MSAGNVLVDTFVRIKNGYRINLNSILVINSKKVIPVLEVLYKEGFIRGYNIDLNDSKKIKVLLKYTSEGKGSLKNIKTISKSGCRVYAKVDDLWKLSLQEGFGCFILSTSKGILTLKESLKFNIGGELLCYAV